MLKKLGRKLAKAVKKPAGAAAAGAMLGGKMKGPMGAAMGAGLGAMLARRRSKKAASNQPPMAPATDTMPNTDANPSGFKKGGMADKKGRAMPPSPGPSRNSIQLPKPGAGGLRPSIGAGGLPAQVGGTRPFVPKPTSPRILPRGMPRGMPPSPPQGTTGVPRFKDASPTDFDGGLTDQNNPRLTKNAQPMGRAGTAAFKKGGMADKKGRAMKKTDADAMGRAMVKKPKKMMGGGMMRGYKKGGMAKKGC